MIQRFRFFLGLVLVIPVALHAEVPKLINYSGKIINNQTGQLASDGDYDMVFTLYDGPSGASVWQEGHNSPGNRVHITNGMYNVILGGITPMPSFDKNYYLEMQFKKYTDSTYEVFPKQQLLSNAYAIRSEYANQVADGAVSNAKIVSGTINYDRLAADAVSKILPVGSIIAWHKNIKNPALSLPSTGVFMECNGQTVNDATSPLNGLVLPNLNGEGRFLRGAGTSGVNQNDAFQGHKHPSTDDGSGSFKYNGMILAGGAGYAATNPSTGLPTNDGVDGEPRIASETRPKNMSIVWVMKVK